MTNEYSSSIRYIGVDDLDIDLFESQYIVPEGMSYNSWVILDEKIAIMDTADGRKEKEWTSNLVAALDGRTPDYLVCQHMEPDHAGNIATAMAKYPEMKIENGVIFEPILAPYFAKTTYEKFLIYYHN